VAAKKQRSRRPKVLPSETRFSNTCAVAGCSKATQQMPPPATPPWCNLTASPGDENAGHERDLLSKAMTLEQVAEGQRRAAVFVAKEESPGGSVSAGVTQLPQMADTGLKASGTAFFISADGYLLTNFHVVEGAAKVMVKAGSGLLRASVIKTDSVNDVALLKVSGSFKALPIGTTSEGRFGESVFTVGFPNIRLQGIEPKLTRGEISSVSGIQDDPRQFQISVPARHRAYC
jgi:S1-C subfamily serine protease